MPLPKTRLTHIRKIPRHPENGVAHGVLLVPFLLLLCVSSVSGGSRLIEPPARQSLWRYGHGTVVNFYDDDVNCGGFNTHQVTNNGLCGVCGDPWNSPVPRDHEAGGKIAPDPRPVRAYKKGGLIPVAVDSTADLLGKYEFRLCKLNASNDTPAQACFDQTPLTIREAEYGQSYQIGQSGGLASLHLQLPETLVCGHCILQWRHVTGYKTNRQDCVQCGTEAPKCTFCKGCGAQEWYQGCVDIAVYDTTGTHPALAGVSTQQELKNQWEATLASYKNCTCPSGGNSVVTSPGASLPGSNVDNTINSTYPYPVSPSSGVNVITTVPIATLGPTPVPPNHETPVMPKPTPNNPVTKAPVLPGGGSNGQTVPSTNTNNNNNNNNIVNTVSPGTKPGTSVNNGGNPSKPTVKPDNNINNGISHPIFNPYWNNQFRPPNNQWNRTCYVPYRAPSFLVNARDWCVQNCPRRQNFCNYNVCRPVACGQTTQTRTPQRNFAWLLPFLLMDGFELK